MKSGSDFIANKRWLHQNALGMDLITTFTTHYGSIEKEAIAWPASDIDNVPIPGGSRRLKVAASLSTSLSHGDY